MTREKTRIILHCDLNCFYASVELLAHPELRTVPVAVCGDPNTRHGIILAKNEPAKRCGIVTAETIWQAKKKCPDLVLLPPHRELYPIYSQKVNAIYEQYTDLVEPFGIDESWLDITGTVHLFGGDSVRVADEIRSRIREELGLTASAGVSFNKVFAKLGSDYRKPDATTAIPPEGWQSIVWPLPAGALLFVGQAAQKILRQYGIQTIGQLAAAPRTMLETLMGKLGTQLWDYANGLDRSPVRPYGQRDPVKSIGNGTTFPENLTTRSQVTAAAALLCDQVASRLRREGLYAGGVQITLRDPAFHDRSRQMQLAAPTHLMRELLSGVTELLAGLWQPPSPIRMLTVTAIHLVDEQEAFTQLDLFEAQQAAPRRERQERLEGVLDTIREKYGTAALRFGADRRGEESSHDQS